MIFLVSGWFWGTLEPAERVVPAVNVVPPDAPVGRRPYEMEDVGRPEERIPLVDFEDLSGWTIHLYHGAEAIFSRSREEQMGGEFVGKLLYRGTSKESRLIIAPPTPIPIPQTFDCVNLWCYGNNWDWAPDPTTPQVNLSVWLEDVQGISHRIPLTNVRWREWWLIHRRIPAETLSKMTFPCRFSGLEVSGIANTEDRTLYFDSLAFYTEEMKPLSFEPRPARNLKPFPGQTHGLNGTGKGTLPFPTREETILPDNFETLYETHVNQNTDGSVTFRYIGRDAEIRYLYVPEEGLQVFVDGQFIGKAFVGGGVRPGEGQLESVALENNEVVTHFLYEGERRVEYRLRLWQKSLVMDVFALGGWATELFLGTFEEVENPRLIQIPYLTYGSSNPRVLLMGSKNTPVFASVWVDWYRSNGSELFSQDRVEGKTAQINGGIRYHPKTDGTRNDLFERLFLTVSPIFEETLPTIANPPSPWGEVAGPYLWQESWGPENYKKEHDRSRLLRSYGIEHLIQCNHEITWRDGGESFTLRTKAAPGKGGDDALREYVAAQKSLGWRSGLYTNYTDYAPVNAHWDEDSVQRTPENEWRPAWPRCYALKPSRAVEWDARLAPLIKEKYDPNAAYTDVHTAVAPWNYCDYDARVPGAGTFAATFYAYGEILLNDQKVYGGPVFSEGTYQWLYAGLASGNYALAYTDMDFSEYPLLVAFDLLKIHPLECDVGMPWTSQFFARQPGWKAPEQIEASIDRFIAATLAYGHLGWLVEEAYGIRRTCRSYYLIQPIAKRYAMRRAVRIEYANEEGQWLTTSQALATGAIQNSRLHVVYENGLELYVNWDKKREWRFSQTRRKDLPKEFTLPPNGFIAFDGEDFLAASAMWDGHRVDQVVSDEYVYLDGRDQKTSNIWLTASGAVAMKFVQEGSELIALELIDIEGNQRIGFRCDFEQAICSAYDPEGNFLGEVPLEHVAEKREFNTVSGARKYRVTPRR